MTLSSDRKDVDELTKEFLAESLEGLDRMERSLTELEFRPSDEEVLGELFRAVHTMKGAAGFLGFTRLEKLAHTGESLLGSLREGRLIAEEEIVSGLLWLTDRLREILHLIQGTGAEGTRERDEDSALIEHLLWLNQESGTRLKKDGFVVPRRATPESWHGHERDKVERTVRVDVELLDRLVNQVSELVSMRNRAFPERHTSKEAVALSRKLDQLTEGLRETVIQARMQPVGYVFGRFKRLVRDLARTCGKKARVEFTGSEIVLDRSLLEAIKDPLIHAVRNAVDHGIEVPAVRVAAGKSEEGVICMQASRKGASVLFEVCDDGAGISRDKVMAKAVEQHIIRVDQVVSMTREEGFELIFLPGFSTALEVTHISGRGVGMDVVRSNVERVGGSVEVHSTAGQGTAIRMCVPQTMTMIPKLISHAGKRSVTTESKRARGGQHANSDCG